MWSLSKERKIQILLTVDTIFFFIELSSGYAVHSLALVADAFHMLNDVISLCVGLWAVKVATTKTKSSVYTYGWQRAETLGALFNGVFLIALCLSIFLEAIQRLIDPPEVKQPVLILIVGSWGLLSNILGLLLFHDHGHSHGGHSHGHSHEHTESTDIKASKNLSPQLIEEGRSNSGGHSSRQDLPGPAGISGSDFAANADGADAGPSRRRRSRSFGYGGPHSIPIHPASLRNEIIMAAQSEESQISDDNEDEDEPSEETPLVSHTEDSRHRHSDEHDHDHDHNHGHRQGHNKTKNGGGHSHADLNMQGVFLHVVGDALGNIGVILSALIIWKSDSPYRYYADPIISLIITFIILGSAVPLCKAASRILLQAVPAGISIDDIQKDILTLPGVKDCHHLHVWQLSDTKLVASLHVQVDLTAVGSPPGPAKDTVPEGKQSASTTESTAASTSPEDSLGMTNKGGEGSAKYMVLARDIRRCLHEYGIHSSTIQPEFWGPAGSNHPVSFSTAASSVHLHDDGVNGGAGDSDDEHPLHGRTTPQSMGPCMLECGAECGPGQQCCAPVDESGSRS